MNPSEIEMFAFNEILCSKLKWTVIFFITCLIELFTQREMVLDLKDNQLKLNYSK